MCCAVSAHTPQKPIRRHTHTRFPVKMHRIESRIEPVRRRRIGRQTIRKRASDCLDKFKIINFSRLFGWARVTRINKFTGVHRNVYAWAFNIKMCFCICTKQHMNTLFTFSSLYLLLHMTALRAYYEIYIF